MIRFLFSVILGGAALFGSGYAIWNIAPPKLPAEYRPLIDIGKYPSVLEAITASDMKSGVYGDGSIYKTPEEKAKEKEDADKAAKDEGKEVKADDAKKGPMPIIVYQNPAMFSMQDQLMYGGGQCLGAAFLLALIVKGASLGSFIGRWLIAILTGVLIAVWSQGNQFIWMHYAREYVQFDAAYTAIAFAIAGFFIAMGTAPEDRG